MAFNKFGSGEGLDNWSRKISDLMDEMLNRSFVSYRDCGAWRPAVNLYETREAYVLCIELAGIDRERVTVQCVDERRVLIAGSREQPRPPHHEAYSIAALEIDEGPFRREVELSEAVEFTQVEITFVKGYLWVTLPRKAKR